MLVEKKSKYPAETEKIKKFLSDTSKYFFDIFNMRLRSRITEFVERYKFPDNEELINFVMSGKKVRSLALLLTAGSLGIDPTEDNVLDVAVAVEFAHRSILIIDDIVDNSFIRNSDVTLPKKIGDGKSSLIASLLQSFSFEIIPNELARYLSIGISRTNQGQLLENSFSWLTRNNFDSTLKRIVSLKSASLGIVALTFGSYLATKERSQELTKMASFLANAYQIANDISGLNVWLNGNSDTIPDDIMNRTINFPILQAVKREVEQGERILLLFMQDKIALDSSELRTIMKNAEPIQSSQQHIKNLLDKASNLIEHTFEDNLFSQNFQLLSLEVWPKMYENFSKSLLS